MARPPHADAAATRARILGSAATLFADQGVGQTSMRQIARTAGVTQATVHHYFGSKDELYASAVDAMYEEVQSLREEIIAAFDPAGTVRTYIARAVSTSFRFSLEHATAVRLVFRQMLDVGELDQERRRRVLLPFLEQGAALLASATGQPPERVRMLLLSLNYLVVRYALCSPAELCEIAELPPPATGDEHDPRAVAHVDAHLVDVAASMFWPDRGSGG